MSLKDEELNFLSWERILTGITRFVDVGQTRGIRFEIRAKEQGHKVSHCHFIYQGRQVSVSLLNCKILAGNIPPKQQKTSNRLG